MAGFRIKLSVRLYTYRIRYRADTINTQSNLFIKSTAHYKKPGTVNHRHVNIMSSNLIMQVPIRT